MRRDRRKPGVKTAGGKPETVAPPVWDKDPYPLIEDGPILVRVIGWTGPQYIRMGQRWSIIIWCSGIDTPVTLGLFLNLAGDESGPGTPGRQSKFFKHWGMANGEQPKKGQRMSWDVFLGKCFVANAGKVKKDSRGTEKGEAEVYSVITHFIRREEDYEFPEPLPEITNQKSGIRNPPITQSEINQSSLPSEEIVNLGSASAGRWSAHQR